jgi:hypothetical protein
MPYHWVAVEKESSVWAAHSFQLQRSDNVITVASAATENSIKSDVGYVMEGFNDLTDTPTWHRAESDWNLAACRDTRGGECKTQLITISHSELATQFRADRYPLPPLCPGLQATRVIP